MENIKAIMVDTEKGLMRQLRKLLSNLWPELVICAQGSSGEQALQLVERHHPHIAFLDVRLPEICGMKVSRRISGNCRVVFITAHDHYAVNAFDSGAIDYILKPLTRERLEKTVRRLKETIAVQPRPSVGVNDIVLQVINQFSGKNKPDYLKWIHVRQKSGIRLISVDEIVYFQAKDRYTNVITRKDESLIRKSIKELSDELDPNQFWRIHRGAIVNVTHVDRVGSSKTGRGTIRLKDRPEALTVSRGYLHLFKQM